MRLWIEFQKAFQVEYCNQWVVGLNGILELWDHANPP